ncbi:NAD(P)H-dependent glycerol-3-phosphate dehydrogenase [Thermodesulfobacteriota bacterium]
MATGSSELRKSIRIGVLGAGSWGTALSQHLARKGYTLDLLVHEPDVKDQIQQLKENKSFFPGVKLSERIVASNDGETVVGNKNFIVVVVPSHVLRETASRVAPFVSKDAIVVSASKGIEIKTHLTMSGVLREVFGHVSPERIGALSGPSFAREVARGLPTLVTVAFTSQELAETAQEVFATPSFRVYTNQDLMGVELGGSVKNVMAIAAGISDGLGLGSNTRAALITRGLTEIRRLGVHLGADPRTFSGLAGVGDLVLTCTDDQSRNHTLGKKIGRGMKLDEILAEMRMVAEGVRTARSLYNLSRNVGVEMPIALQVYRILYEGVEPMKALRSLMTRSLRDELEE